MARTAMLRNGVPVANGTVGHSRRNSHLSTLTAQNQDAILYSTVTNRGFRGFPHARNCQNMRRNTLQCCKTLHSTKLAPKKEEAFISQNKARNANAREFLDRSDDPQGAVWLTASDIDAEKHGAAARIQSCPSLPRTPGIRSLHNLKHPCPHLIINDSSRSSRIELPPDERATHMRLLLYTRDREDRRPPDLRRTLHSRTSERHMQEPFRRCHPPSANELLNKWIYKVFDFYPFSFFIK